jgi:glycosyltransferase involved in cell wall biosynthesis
MCFPGVVNNVGGVGTGFTNGITGFLIDYPNLDLFASKIVSLYSNEEMRIKMGKDVREFIVKHYDNKTLGNQLIKIYSDN